MNCDVCEYYKNSKCDLPYCMYDEVVKDHTKHKCYRCEWTTWTGTKYYCMWSRCEKSGTNETM